MARSLRAISAISAMAALFSVKSGLFVPAFALVFLQEFWRGPKSRAIARAVRDRRNLGTEIRVVDMGGAPVPPGGEGELRVRGPQLCRGYLDAALDGAAFDADGFFRTGDLGRLDAGQDELAAALRNVGGRAR